VGAGPGLVARGRGRAVREFFLNPPADPETVCRRIARNQYGPAAGETAFRAWQALERAHRILSNCTVWCPGQWPGWYNGKGNDPLPTSMAVPNGTRNTVARSNN